MDVKDGAVVRVRKNAPVFARASAGNLQEAKWITPQNAKGRAGGVYLASTKESELDFLLEIPHDTAYLADAEFDEFVLAQGISRQTKVQLQMTAMDRAWFGEKLEFVLQPVDEE